MEDGTLSEQELSRDVDKVSGKKPYRFSNVHADLSHEITPPTAVNGPNDFPRSPGAVVPGGETCFPVYGIVGPFRVYLSGPANFTSRKAKFVSGPLAQN